MASEKNAGEENVQKIRRTRSVWFHLGLACLSGFVLYVVLVFAGWVNLRESNPTQRRNQHRITSVFEDAQEFLKTRHSSIANTKQLHEALQENLLDQNASNLDLWGNEIQYELDSEGELVVYSFGRDGKPDGTGLDADVYHDKRNHAETIPSFTEFYEPGMWTNSILRSGAFFCGIISFVLFLLLYHSDSVSGRSEHPAVLVLYTLVTVGLSIAIGLVLLPLHVPSGH